MAATLHSYMETKMRICNVVLLAGLSVFAVGYTQAGVVNSASVPKAADIPVNATCTSTINEQIGEIIYKGGTSTTNGVEICGTVTSVTTQPDHGSGPHHIVHLTAPLPASAAQPGNTYNVEIAVNDNLDGSIDARKGDTVFAYGQAYSDADGTVGVHDVHCSTGAGIANGWVVVEWPNNKKVYGCTK